MVHKIHPETLINPPMPLLTPGGPGGSAAARWPASRRAFFGGQPLDLAELPDGMFMALGSADTVITAPPGG